MIPTSPHGAVTTGSPRRTFWLVLVGLTALLVTTSQVPTARVLESGDSAANAILVDKAKHLHLLVGHYSRFRFNHPGPAFLYVQAAGEGLFHDLVPMTRTAYVGQLLGLLLLNAFLVALAASIVHRRAGGPAAAALVAGVLVVGIVEPGSLASTWMPHLYLWPFLLLLVATASVCSGGWREFTALILAGGLLVHGHVAFVLFVALAFAAAALTLVRSRPTRRQVLPAAALLALFALPMVLHVVLDWPGELRRYWDYTRSGSAGGASLSGALRYVGGITGLGQLGGTVALLVVASAASLRWASRRRPCPARAFTDGLLSACLVMLAAGLVYAVRGVDDLTLRYLELFLLVVPVALAAALVGQVDQALAGRGAKADRGPLPRWRAGLVAAAGLVAVIAVAPAVGDLRCGPMNQFCPGAIDVSALWDDVQDEVPSGPLALSFETTAWPPSVGVLEQARRAGREVCVTDAAWAFMVTDEVICTAEQLARTATVSVEPTGPGTYQAVLQPR